MSLSELNTICKILRAPSNTICKILRAPSNTMIDANVTGQINMLRDIHTITGVRLLEGDGFIMIDKNFVASTRVFIWNNKMSENEIHDIARKFYGSDCFDITFAKSKFSNINYSLFSDFSHQKDYPGMFIATKSFIMKPEKTQVNIILVKTRFDIVEYLDCMSKYLSVNVNNESNINELKKLIESEKFRFYFAVNNEGQIMGVRMVYLYEFNGVKFAQEYDNITLELYRRQGVSTGILNQVLMDLDELDVKYLTSQVSIQGNLFSTSSGFSLDGEIYSAAYFKRLVEVSNKFDVLKEES